MKTPHCVSLCVAALGLALLASCGPADAEGEGGDAGATTKPTTKPMAAAAAGMEGYDTEGAPLSSLEATAIADVLADPASFEGKTVRIEGPIDSVCQSKGCWMRIGDAENNVFVKFKDYEFFVPLDASGRTAVMEGELTVKKIPLDEAKHYLEDAGKHAEAEALTEEPTEVTFMASGVALKKR